MFRKNQKTKCTRSLRSPMLRCSIMIFLEVLAILRPFGPKHESASVESQYIFYRHLRFGVLILHFMNIWSKKEEKQNSKTPRLYFTDWHQCSIFNVHWLLDYWPTDYLSGVFSFSIWWSDDSYQFKACSLS